jgi:hypothetical protein
VSSAAVVNDDRFNNDVIHVSNLLEADSSDEDHESNKNEHLNNHFFSEFCAREILILA